MNVAPPPTDSPPAHAKGKTPASDITPAQLRRRKIDALHLCLLFVISVKHYLRGEDGLNWDDYRGIVPAWFRKFTMDVQGSSYMATRDNSLAPSESSWTEGATSFRGDATKRIRVKRSKPQISGATTPLLDGHRVVNFPQDEASMPLPLMYGAFFRIVLG